jgi:MscS family membrane protein
LFQSIVDFFIKDQIKYVFNDFTSSFTYDRFKYIGIAIGVFALFVLLKKIFAKYVFKIILKLVNKTKFTADTKIVSAFERPLINFFEVLGLFFAFRILTYAFPISILFIDKVFSSAIIILISWGVYNLTGDSSLLFEKMHKAYDVKVDNILFPFISKTLRLIIVALAITIIAEKWGYNIQGFITGLGLGGLAFALAAKDAAANIIAGIFIILDKPFSIGDWISTGELEGTVEDISFRSSRIRTFDQAVITVPNSKLANEPVTNYTRRGKRRVNFNLAITFDTPREKLELCVGKIRNMIEDHPEINKEVIHVRFDKFNDCSLDIFIQFFTDTIEFDDYLRIKENINLNIMEILQELGISIAFPSRSVYLESVPKKNKNEDFKLLDMLQQKEISIENNDKQ